MHSLSSIDKCIDSLSEETVFSRLDANYEYWQVKIEERDRDTTAFNSSYGLFRFIRIIFRLKEGPAIFQRAMDVPSICPMAVRAFLLGRHLQIL